MCFYFLFLEVRGVGNGTNLSLSLIELDLPFSLLNKPLWNECLCEKDYHIRLGELELRTCLEADANSTIKD